MHQERWIYYGIQRSHIVELFHFEHSGLVVIKLNGNTFYSQEHEVATGEESISFFVDSELCKVDIVKKDNAFSYNFISSDYTTSQIGKRKQLFDRLKEWGIGTAMILMLVGILSIPIIYLWQRENGIKKGGILANATILYVGKHKAATYEWQGQTYKLVGNTHYRFLVNGEWYYGAMENKAERINTFTNQHGFPITKGASFKVVFNDRKPSSNYLLFERPTNKQIENYQLLARGSCFAIIGVEEVSSIHVDYCDCVIGELYRKYGLNGLAYIYLQAEERSYLPLLGKERVAVMRDDVKNRIDQGCQEELVSEEGGNEGLMEPQRIQRDAQSTQRE